MFNDFKKFLMRGNVFDLAIGIIIGAAFGKIVSSFVADILTPLLSLFMGKVDFSNLFIALDGRRYPTMAEAKAAGVSTLNLGIFANAVIDFVIVGFAIFMMMKFIERVRHRAKQEEKAATPPPPPEKECTYCLMKIPLKATKCGHCTSVF